MHWFVNMKSEFITSAAEKSQWPDTTVPEVVVVGRSNVGKSSFINAFCQRKKLAYVGSTPGKTRLINFFLIDDTWMLVDVPGYGYAKMSKSMLEKLGVMMDTYFNEREQISCVVQLVDSRHEPTQDDLHMVEMLKELGVSIVVVATKIDKVPKTKRIKALKLISSKLQLPLRSIYPVSSTEKLGFDEVKDALMEILDHA